MRSWTCSSSAAGTSSTLPTSIRVGAPRRSSAAGWRPVPACATGSSSPRRAALRWATDRTTPACPAPTWVVRWTPAWAASASIPSTSTRLTPWDPLTPIEETLGFFEDAVRAGKTRYAGVSNFVGWQLQKAALLASGAAPVVTLQPQYNLLVRDIEFEVIDVCRNEGIGILPWSPLAGGWLTGKYARDERPAGATRLGEDPDRGMEAFGPRNAEERTWRIVDAVRTVADGRGVSMAQVALAWVADRPAVTSVILGARTVAQLGDNLDAADLRLSDEEVGLLTEVSNPPISDYPYGQPGIAQRSRELGC